MSAPLRPRATAAPLVFPRTLAVGVLGAGRVGAVLGAALAAAGHRVVAASGASGATKARLALLLPQTPHRSASAVARAAADLLIVAVPDDALAGVVADLAASG
ncbi:NAD(P)-binding domain-containing protein, partial [Micromonospora aurantiaca (nom. illeg.)]|uniref:NAD(P)-binding domain-containing protein n=2 Tax=Micromonosporaceae TaxID=28056 RepID=UPI00380C7AF9